MKTSKILTLALTVILALTGTACGRKEAQRDTIPNAQPDRQTQPEAIPSILTSKAAEDCPQHNTKSFAKTRFVANAGLALGAFHHWIYRPYQRNAFSSQAPKRASAFVKAGLAGAFTLEQLRRAKNNAKANPTLCRAVAAPFTELMGKMSSLKSKFTNKTDAGDDIQGSESIFQRLRILANRNGAGFIEKQTAIPNFR